ncbi:DEAD/DEAH box helicase [Romeria aff. gracilis LEGE 07310]|uniref:DEAD/DEAH box helicase n=1 Tax=Vasconcelosia minhoensis LEGE 07310 TaxID=915328 RepID=A0A8J7AJE3_9CYAN|nr:DEAD/DEAH box helicase [Romeria gracilis]MBE9076485.1 DEAD/DEAH box helicase [Romeria aff. gracilis LEGE 07310]
MAILHGSWRPDLQRFFLWGETWRRLDAEGMTEPVPTYPYQVSRDELADLIQAQQSLPEALDLGWLLDYLTVPQSSRSKRTGGTVVKAKTATHWQSLTVALPAQRSSDSVLPQHSAEASEPSAADSVLYPWQVEGLLLPPAAAMQLLNSLPLGLADSGSIIGAELRYWSHVTRWGLDLLVRAKFIPTVSADRKGAIAQWQILLDSAVDQTRLQQFSDRMPLTCRFYQTEALAKETSLAPWVNLPAAPQPLLRSFLETLVSHQVRTVAQSQPLPANATLSKDLPLREWVNALAAKNPHFEAPPAGLVRLNDALNTWTAPLQNVGDAVAAFRTCLALEPPPSGQLDWTLHYGLQATADESFRVDAATVWQHPVDRFCQRDRCIDSPQETLLAGLGRAARLYEPIKESLTTQSPESCTLDPIQAYQFIKATAWRLQDNGFGVILPSNLVDSNAEGNSRLGLQVSAAAPGRQQQRLGLQSLLKFNWKLSIGGQTVTQEEFNQLVTQGTPLVEINGQWVELRPQDVRAAKDFFAKRQAQNQLSVEDALRISTGDNQLIDKLPVVKFEASGQLEDLITTLTTGNQTLDPMTEPDGFHGQLRPYQARGVSWLAFLEQWGLGACLADDMGLGKTIQLIAFLLYLRQEKALDGPVLLVCPTSVLTNWDREVRRFGPELKTLVYHGDKRPRGATFAKAAAKANLIITSYTLVHRDLKDLKRVQWRGLVLDEAQNIKNADARQSQAVRQLEGDFRIALTGTPVENRLSELWSIMDFLNPGYLGPQNFFRRRFATPIERYGDTASLRTLRSLVQPFILRRLKTDRSIIQDLPEKQEMTVFCGLSAEQARLYQKLVEETLSTIDEAEGVQRRGLILGLLTKLKQICNHPAQFLKQDSLGKYRRSGKLQRLDEMLEEVIAEGDRALIFTQFAEWGKLLERHLEAHLKEEAMFLYGSTSKQNREAMVDRFQQDPNGPKLFILSLKAGGVGLNLTRANHVFHFDRWWNPAVENQATDRVFRIGQTRNVQVHKFVCTGTLEERINDMIEGKKALAEQVVGGGEQWLTELDTDQLRDLLLLDRSAVIDDAA